MEKRGKTEKMSITLPRELAGEVRSLVSQGEVSAFFTEALEHYLAFRRQKNALEKGFGVWKKELHPDLISESDTGTYVRSVRADKERLARLGGTRAL